MPIKNLTSFKEVSLTENENIIKSKLLFGDQIRNYVETYELLFELNEHIGNQSITKKIVFDCRDSVVLMLSSRALLTLKGCFGLLMKGYYYDVEVLHRSLFENLCVIMYVVLCGDKEKANERAIKWLNGELKIYTVKKELNGIGNYEQLLEAYKILCGYVHSDFKSIRTLIDFSKGSVDLSSKPIFKPAIARKAFYPHIEFSILNLLIANFSEVIEPVFKSQTLHKLEILHQEAERLMSKNLVKN
jgi:hypothetical protein